MFGYVRVAEDELLVKELKLYKDCYCALCKQIACFSQPARLLLSYDMTFFVLLSEIAVQDTDKQCRHRFLRRCKRQCGDIKLQYIASFSIIMQYYKLQDDVIDGKKSRRFVMNMIESGFEKVSRIYPELAAQAKSGLETLRTLEQEKTTDLDALENSFCGIFRELYRNTPYADDCTELRGQIAFHIAAWVYWFDMLQDVDEDKKSGNFNAILLGDESVMITRITERLTAHLEAAETLCEALPHSRFVGIIRNIIAYGLPMQMQVKHEQKAERCRRKKPTARVRK